MAATGELGRLTTIFFWARHSDMWGISSMLFGYGLNATNSGSAVSAGYLNIIFRLVLDSTSLSMLLWEVGIVGTVLFISLLLWIVWHHLAASDAGAQRAGSPRTCGCCATARLSPCLSSPACSACPTARR
ncbi:Uncharacterised protein [Kluyvera cryocrescens]|uniref:Uncharacterized protein n=1 Tax=Kluyvera cryocrescens TaxID=580 RepID=A0A485D2Y7_KLUCR|nr:Uncharacterised protein [Kluyvera cryocrescens]